MDQTSVQSSPAFYFIQWPISCPGLLPEQGDLPCSQVVGTIVEKSTLAMEDPDNRGQSIVSPFLVMLFFFYTCIRKLPPYSQVELQDCLPNQLHFLKT